ncbi:hypothetical protein AB0284_07160 [Pseudarthrobacter phenanthrenivorans]|uniref:hypothetical protein n=1 Tax=Pseudarthrobacter phenanthrenivorans TaxID=361575 RepID=UPI00344C2871
MRTGLGILGTGLLLAATLATTGCGTACPAIGYISIITVTVEGNADTVDEVQLCSDQGCSQRLPTHGAATSIPSIPPGTSATTSPDHIAQPAFLSSLKDAHTWEFTVSQSGNPRHITVRALAADRTVLVEQQNDLVWTKADGYAPCAGPITTPPIPLRLP